VWEVLNERFTGKPDCNLERYALYRAGKLTYPEWVALDIGGWRDAGARRDDLFAAFAQLELVPGTRETLRALAEVGHRLVVISGTLDVFLESLLPERPFDEVYTTKIGFDDSGQISGWHATPYDMQGKAEILRTIAAREGIPLSRCAFIGDSSNDVWIAREAGLGIAFNPKSTELEEAADVVLRSDDLRVILPHFPPARI
jgi:phosphoserine phosphatase